MTLEEWIAKYNEKTPEPFKRDERYSMFYLPDKGFCEVGRSGDLVVIHQLAGDARFWKKHVSDMARKIGVKVCGTWCVRKEILAYIRLFGYRIYKTEETGDGRKRYYGIDSEDKKGLASPAFTFADGTQAYFITWEV